ncbi:MAG: hypothetical protein OEZ43_20505 [Gammaproteobacteria bacterium]|nr:hypothetical protein [Gammaproteobacteria bacterium]
MKNVNIVIKVFIVSVLFQHSYSFASNAADPHHFALNIEENRDLGNSINLIPIVKRDRIPQILIQSQAKLVDRGTATGMGASIGALAAAIFTFCTDAFSPFSSRNCSLFNVPAIVFGSLVGGAVGYGIVYQYEHMMVGYRVRF